MDNLTHSLVGALLGQVGLKRKTGLAMPALIIGANIPDIDAACFFWLEGTQHLAFRRGITHGPIAWVLLPVVLAGLLYGFDRWQARRGKRPEGRLPVRFGWLYGLSFLACLTHPALDWLNAYGIRLLEPFSSRWFYGDTLFIIDVWLWVLLGFATWLSLRRERRGGDWRRVARIALSAASLYIFANGLITGLYQRHYRAAVGQGPMLIASPIPFLFWQREGLIGSEHQWAALFKPHPEDEHLHAKPLARTFCTWPDTAVLRQANPGLDAFLFWSRAPFAERAPGGSVLIRDARFYDPRARDRFTVALPDVRCEAFGGE